MRHDVATTTTRWFRTRSLQERYDVSRQTIWSWRKKGILPKPVQIGPNTVAWSPEQIAQFERQRAGVK